MAKTSPTSPQINHMMLAEILLIAGTAALLIAGEPHWDSIKRLCCTIRFLLKKSISRQRIYMARSKRYLQMFAFVTFCANKWTNTPPISTAIKSSVPTLSK